MESHLCYEATAISLDLLDEGAALLLIETADDQANLAVALSAEAAQSLVRHIVAAFPLRLKLVVPE